MNKNGAQKQKKTKVKTTQKTKNTLNPLLDTNAFKYFIQPKESNEKMDEKIVAENNEDFDPQKEDDIKKILDTLNTMQEKAISAQDQITNVFAALKEIERMISSFKLAHFMSNPTDQDDNDQISCNKFIEFVRLITNKDFDYERSLLNDNDFASWALTENHNIKKTVEEKGKNYKEHVEKPNPECQKYKKHTDFYKKIKHCIDLILDNKNDNIPKLSQNRLLKKESKAIKQAKDNEPDFAKKEKIEQYLREKFLQDHIEENKIIDAINKNIKSHGIKYDDFLPKLLTEIFSLTNNNEFKQLRTDIQGSETDMRQAFGCNVLYPDYLSQFYFPPIVNGSVQDKLKNKAGKTIYLPAFDTGKYKNLCNKLCQVEKIIRENYPTIYSFMNIFMDLDTPEVNTQKQQGDHENVIWKSPTHFLSADEKGDQTHGKIIKDLIKKNFSDILEVDTKTKGVLLVKTKTKAKTTQDDKKNKQANTKEEMIYNFIQNFQLFVQKQTGVDSSNIATTINKLLHAIKNHILDLCKTKQNGVVKDLDNVISSNLTPTTIEKKENLAKIHEITKKYFEDKGITTNSLYNIYTSDQTAVNSVEAVNRFYNQLAQTYQILKKATMPGEDLKKKDLDGVDKELLEEMIKTDKNNNAVNNNNNDKNNNIKESKIIDFIENDKNNNNNDIISYLKSMTTEKKHTFDKAYAVAEFFSKYLDKLKNRINYTTSIVKRNATVRQKELLKATQETVNLMTDAIIEIGNKINQYEQDYKNKKNQIENENNQNDQIIKKIKNEKQIEDKIKELKAQYDNIQNKINDFFNKGYAIEQSNEKTMRELFNQNSQITHNKKGLLIQFYNIRQNKIKDILLEIEKIKIDDINFEIEEEPKKKDDDDKEKDDDKKEDDNDKKKDDKDDDKKDNDDKDDDNNKKGDKGDDGGKGEQQQPQQPQPPQPEQPQDNNNKVPEQQPPQQPQKQPEEQPQDNNNKVPEYPQLPIKPMPINPPIEIPQEKEEEQQIIPPPKNDGLSFPSTPNEFFYADVNNTTPNEQKKLNVEDKNNDNTSKLIENLNKKKDKPEEYQDYLTTLQWMVVIFCYFPLLGIPHLISIMVTDHNETLYGYLHRQNFLEFKEKYQNSYTPRHDKKYDYANYLAKKGIKYPPTIDKSKDDNLSKSGPDNQTTMSHDIPNTNLNFYKQNGISFQ